MEQIELKADVRKTTGNGPARVLRREGKIPAVLYGPETEPVLLSVNTGDFEEVLKKGNVSQVLLNLVIQNGKTFSKSVIIKELQMHPVSQDFIHIDFYEIDMKRRIKVNVPIVTQGKSKGVELGGVIQIIRHELEVLCFPGDIPKEIVIDITELDMGDSVHVEEIPLEGDMEIQADVNYTVLTVLSPKVEEEEVEEEEEELEEGEEGAAEGEETSEAGKEIGKEAGKEE
ncbi:MAG: 50S ribosomal protein L25/general stress protein Ctc [Desulfobacteraceae bacterium 4572_123]|nr:MAG: 50S ribosomal protein L25/general stress protein Ctc [Desulfobacteraceae bacterium 4572_123]